MESRPDNPHPEAREPPHQPSSYRPISLLPIASKVFEKLLKRLLPLVEHANLMPGHQFGFRPRHSTIEQIHRLIRVLNDALDNGQYCSAAFLDISQAFYKVWHTGLLYKLRRSLPLNYFIFLNSCLIATSLLKSTLNSQALPQSTQGFLKAVSSALYYISYIQLTFQPRLTPSLPPLPTTLQ
jgi:hypothetical protein